MKAVLLGKDLGQHGHAFLGAVFLVARDQDDGLALARALASLELENFLARIDEGYDVAAGVRTVETRESWARRVMGLGCLWLAHLIVFRQAVVDSQCGFKVFTRDAARKIFSLSEINGGTIDVEIFYFAHRLNLRIAFVLVAWKNAPGSTINPLRCLAQDPIDMIRIRLRGAGAVRRYHREQSV